MKKKNLNIAVTGPECSGKTSLSQQLARRTEGLFVPEYAREYLTNLGRPYTESDLTEIAKGQVNLIQKAVETSSHVVICDTDTTVIKIWSLVKFGSISAGLQSVLSTPQHDLYLLCYPDIPWEFDVLRESPDNREELFELYERLMQEENLNYIVLRGSLEQRLLMAEQHISALIKK